MAELFGALNRLPLRIDASPVATSAAGELVDLITDGTLSGRFAKDAFATMGRTGRSAAIVVAERATSGATAAAVHAVPVAHQVRSPIVVRARRNSGFFVGRAMKATAGKAICTFMSDLLRQARGVRVRSGTIASN